MQINFKAVVTIAGEKIIQNNNPFSVKLRTIDSKSGKRNGKELTNDP
jgi:hypothetical protein